MEQLPPEVLSLLFSFLGVEDLCSLSMVCQSFAAVAADDALWEPHCSPQWARGESKSWKQMYLGWLRRAVTAYTTAPPPEKDGGPDYDRLFKLLLVGELGVGKTSLCERFLSDYFPSYITTIGYGFRLKALNYQGYRVKLQIWDTAGQERFRTITTSYYRYDVTNPKSLERIHYWMNEVATHTTKEVSKLLLGNKMDLRTDPSATIDSFVPIEDAQKLAAEYGIPCLEISAKTAENAEEALQTIVWSLLRCGFGEGAGVKPRYIPSIETLEARGIVRGGAFGSNRRQQQPAKGSSRNCLCQ